MRRARRSIRRRWRNGPGSISPRRRMAAHTRILRRSPGGRGFAASRARLSIRPASAGEAADPALVGKTASRLRNSAACVGHAGDDASKSRSSAQIRANPNRERHDARNGAFGIAVVPGRRRTPPQNFAAKCAEWGLRSARPKTPEASKEEDLRQFQKRDAISCLAKLAESTLGVIEMQRMTEPDAPLLARALRHLRILRGGVRGISPARPRSIPARSGGSSRATSRWAAIDWKGSPLS